VLNCNERLELIRQANEVSGVMADLESERLQKKEEQRLKKAEEGANQEERRLEKAAKEREMMQQSFLKCQDIMTQLAAQGAVYIRTLKVDDLKAVIRYQFKSKDYKKKGIKKPELQLIVTRLYEEYLQAPSSTLAPATPTPTPAPVFTQAPTPPPASASTPGSAPAQDSQENINSNEEAIVSL